MRKIVVNEEGETIKKKCTRETIERNILQNVGGPKLIGTNLI